MNILYVTSEAVPFCKTGGLADVAGSLPQSLAANGDRVSVILPLYQSVADAWRDRLHFERYTYVRLAWRSLYCGGKPLHHKYLHLLILQNESCKQLHLVTLSYRFFPVSSIHAQHAFMVLACYPQPSSQHIFIRSDCILDHFII